MNVRLNNTILVGFTAFCLSSVACQPKPSSPTRSDEGHKSTTHQVAGSNHLKAPTSRPIYQCSVTPASLSIPIVNSDLSENLSVTTSCSCVSAKISPSKDANSGRVIDLFIDVADVGQHSVVLFLNGQDGEAIDQCTVHYDVVSEIQLEVKNASRGTLSAGATFITECTIIRPDADRRELTVMAGPVIPGKHRGSYETKHAAEKTSENKYLVATDAGSSPGYFFRNVWIVDEFGKRVSGNQPITWSVDAPFVTTPQRLILEADDDGLFSSSMIVELEPDVQSLELGGDEHRWVHSLNLELVTPSIYRLTISANLQKRRPELPQEITLLVGTKKTKIKLPVEFSETK